MTQFKRNAVKNCFIHCSATKPSMDIGDAEISTWHKDRGWSDIGYHVVIRRDGYVEFGRPFDQVGAHAKGYNSTSLSVCMVGGIDDMGRPENNFTDMQWHSLSKVCRSLTIMFPGIGFLGHNEVSTKACPSFDVEVYCFKEGLKHGTP